MATFYQNVGLANHELQNFKIQNLASAPTPSGVGHTYYDTVLAKQGTWNGSVWEYAAPLDSPAFLGNPTAPTQAPGNNSTRIATTAFVEAAVVAAGAVPDATDTIKGKIQLAGDLGGTAASPTVPGLAGKQNTSEKDATNGYVGLDALKIKFKNTAGSFISFFVNANSAARTYTFPDRTGTIADDTDITGAKARGNHTGTQTASTISDFNAAALAAAPAETVTTSGTLINGATSKTTPVDADQIGLMDSAASNVLKKLSWANLKATLATYFDTLYATLSGTQTLTNKTINASNNTISNLQTSMFATNVIDVDGTLAANSDTRIASQRAVKTLVEVSIASVQTGLVWKTPVLVATTGNITLSGTQTIDGVAVVASDRVLVKDQSTASQNGIYLVAAGAWTRTFDSDTGAEVRNMIVPVEAGTVNADKFFKCSNDGTITVGSTGLTFIDFVVSNVPDATTALKGKVELATTGETDAHTDTTRAVTPASLVNHVKRVVFDDLGDNSAVNFELLHSLGNIDVHVLCILKATQEVIYPKILLQDSNNVVINFGSFVPPSMSFKVIVFG